MAAANTKRPRDAQRGKVAAAVTSAGGFVVRREDYDAYGRVLFARACRSTEARKVCGVKRLIPPPITTGKSTRADATGVRLDAAVIYFYHVRLLALLAEHLTLKHLPADEPLHGWRHAKLLLALVRGVSELYAERLLTAYKANGVRWKAPRRSKPASPAEIERLRGLRMAVALNRVFGEAARPPGG